MFIIYVWGVESMNTEEKKNKLIQARNLLSEVFNDSKESWGDNWTISNLCRVMGNLDSVINTIGTSKPKGIGREI